MTANSTPILNLDPMTVSEFVDRLTRPMYVYRMARAVTPYATEGMKKSAETRRQNAASEIDQLIKEYMSMR